MRQWQNVSGNVSLQPALCTDSTNVSWLPSQPQHATSNLASSLLGQSLITGFWNGDLDSRMAGEEWQDLVSEVEEEKLTTNLVCTRPPERIGQGLRPIYSLWSIGNKTRWAEKSWRKCGEKSCVRVCRIWAVGERWNSWAASEVPNWQSVP